MTNLKKTGSLTVTDATQDASGPFLKEPASKIGMQVQMNSARHIARVAARRGQRKAHSTAQEGTSEEKRSRMEMARGSVHPQY